MVVPLFPSTTTLQQILPLIGILIMTVIPPFHLCFLLSPIIITTLIIILIILYITLLFSPPSSFVQLLHTSTTITITLYSMYILITSFSPSSLLVPPPLFPIVINPAIATSPLIPIPHFSPPRFPPSIVVPITIFFLPPHIIIPPSLIPLIIPFFLSPILILPNPHSPIITLTIIVIVSTPLFASSSLDLSPLIFLSLTFLPIPIQAITTVVISMYTLPFSSLLFSSFLPLLLSNITLIVIPTTIIHIASILLLPYTL